MRAVLQRVSRAEVTVDGRVIGSIGRGFLVLLGVAKDDAEADAEFIAARTLAMRVFADADGKMNLALAQVGGELLVVSQFTLYADCRKGRRPGFDLAAPPEQGARAVVWAHAAEVVEVATEEEGVVLNLNDPETLRRALEARR